MVLEKTLESPLDFKEIKPVNPKGNHVTTGDYRLPLVSALGSPIFPSGCEGKLGVALESLQGLRDLT